MHDHAGGDNHTYAASLGGAKLLELDANGAKVKGYAYGGVLLAKRAGQR